MKNYFGKLTEEKLQQLCNAMPGLKSAIEHHFLLGIKNK